jgi:hypothetical protein
VASVELHKKQVKLVVLAVAEVKELLEDQVTQVDLQKLKEMMVVLLLAHKQEELVAEEQVKQDKIVLVLLVQVLLVMVVMEKKVILLVQMYFMQVVEAVAQTKLMNLLQVQEDQAVVVMVRIHHNKVKQELQTQEVEQEAVLKTIVDHKWDRVVQV